MGCVYMWTNNVNDKKYIGKCHGDVKSRYRHHANGHGSVPLKRAFGKYGIDNFTFEILHDGIIDDFLNYYEIEAIRVHNSKVPYGYNLTDGGEGMLGYSPSTETRRKISVAQKGKKGKPHTAETRHKIGKANSGKTHSEETRRKMSMSRKGRIVSSETRHKISEANSGRKHSVETRRKLSEAKKGEKHNFYGRKRPIETRRKISESKRGKKLSPETCRKMSEAMKGRIPSNRSPYHIPARDMFFSLSDSLTLAEKRENLYDHFLKVKRFTLNKWTLQWQSDLTN